MSETPDYYNMEIQPVEYIMRNNLGFCEGNIVKYISRYKEKGGLSDLEKARHYLELLIGQCIDKDVEEFKTQTLAEQLAEVEKKKADKIANNTEWDAIVKACDRVRRYNKDDEDIID